MNLNNKGEISITLVILTLICMYFITGYYNAVKIGYSMDEIQSSLDIVGVATLEQIIDYEILKDEIYGLDNNNKMDYSGANLILNNYKDQIKSNYRSLISFNENIVPHYSIVSQEVYFERSKWGTGSSAEYKPQIVIETMVKLQINISPGHDNSESYIKNYYSSKENKNLSVLAVNSTKDGKTEIVIRSTVRNLYE